MREISQRSVLSLLLTITAVSPVLADGTADLQTRLDGALKGAKSFVVTTQYPAQAYASTLVFVAPDRTRVAVAVAATTTDVVTIGQTIYSSKNGAPFERSAVPPAAEPRPAAVGSVKVASMRPDVTSGGVTYGAFDTTLPLGKLVTLTCMYDKRNYRLARCANAEVTQTYTSYNDPQNVIEAPKNAVDAPTLEVPKAQ